MTLPPARRFSHRLSQRFSQRVFRPAATIGAAACALAALSVAASAQTASEAANAAVRRMVEHCAPAQLDLNSPLRAECQQAAISARRLMGIAEATRADRDGDLPDWRAPGEEAAPAPRAVIDRHGRAAED